MKKVVSPTEVAHLWANQIQSEARNSGNTFYFDFDTIYSYGSHFAIARHVTNENGEKAVLFTSRRYSRTTNNHVYMASRASSHLKLIIAPFPGHGQKHDNFKFWLNEIKQIANHFINARKNGIYATRIRQIYEHVKDYSAFFNFEIPIELQNAGNIVNADKYREALIQEAKILENRRRIAAEKQKKEFMKKLSEWKSFDGDDVYRGCNLYGNNTGYDYLRFNADKNRVETSQGVQIPAALAKSFYKIVLDTVFNGGCKNCDMLFMQYQVTEINKNFIKVGCHTISIKEIKALTKKIGW